MVKIIDEYYKKGHKKWTVGMVNWKTTDYIYWQLKTLYDFNDPNDFDVFIFDAMFPRSQLNILFDHCKLYQSHKNIKFLQWENKLEKGIRHGSELNHIVRCADSKYFLSNDPDFFWMKKGHLSFLERFLQDGCRSVGVENQKSHDIAIWASAYFLDDIKNLDAQASWFRCTHCSKVLYQPKQDTGWQYGLCTSNRPRKLFLIDDKVKPPFFGPYSHPYVLSKYKKVHDYFLGYSYEKKPVGVHFFRGSYGYELTKTPLPEKWIENRNVYGQYFYNRALESK